MIFVTVGSQLPFDRMVLGVDRWAKERGRTDLFAQIGVGGTPPQHMAWSEELTPQVFLEKMREARLVVAHAGCGSILQGLSMGKTMLLVPRRADLRETRNDHQLATAARMLQLYGVPFAPDEAELFAQLDQLVAEEPAAVPTVRQFASDELLGAVRDFIAGHQARPR